MSAPADGGPCQSPPVQGPPSVRAGRWADRDRASDYDRLARYVGNSPEGVPIRWVVNEAFDDPTAADVKATLCFYREFDDLFHVYKPTARIAVRGPDGLESRETEPIWCGSRPGLPIASIRNSYTADSPPAHDDLPRERAASFLSSMPRLTSDAQRALVLRYVADHKRLHGRAEGDEDAGRMVETEGGTVRVGDRFTSPAKAAETASSVRESLRGLRAVTAEDGVEDLTHVSLTLPREVVDSPLASKDTLDEAIQSLHDSRWRRPKQDGSRNRPGEVPPHVSWSRHRATGRPTPISSMRAGPNPRTT